MHSSLSTVVGLAGTFHLGRRMLMPMSMHRHKRLKRSQQLWGCGSEGVTVRTLVEIVNAFDCYACPFFVLIFMCTPVSRLFFFQSVLFFQSAVSNQLKRPKTLSNSLKSVQYLQIPTEPSITRLYPSFSRLCMLFYLFLLVCHFMSDNGSVFLACSIPTTDSSYRNIKVWWQEINIFT